MSQKLPVRNFKWMEKGDILKFNEDFIKNYDENSDKGYIIEVDVKHPEKFVCYVATWRSYLKE